jgi:chemotaxis protein histidine kinase CheA/ActR/RegA family two-component response regulator
MSAIHDYDTGPLNWICGDVEAALQAALGRLRAFAADADLTNALRLARDDMHQVAGALHMVSLEGAAVVATTLETMLGDINDARLIADADVLHAIENALEGLSRWVRELADGRGSGELALFPAYRQLRLLQGAERVFEGELFFPDLRAGRRAPPALGEHAAAERSVLTKTARAGFQRGLLAFLRGHDQGLPLMRDALIEVETLAPTRAAQTFWWSCVGFLDSLIVHGVEADFHVKQLLARIDLQMRRLMEGAPQVAERLLRDALFFIAKSEAVEGRAAEVRKNFALDRFLPGKGLLDPDTLARMRPLLDTLGIHFKAARDAWQSGINAPSAAHAAVFGAQIEAAQVVAAQMHADALQTLLLALASHAGLEQGLSDEQQDQLNLEIAATLLFLQHALATEDILRGDFLAQAMEQSERLYALAAGQVLAQARTLNDVAAEAASARDMLLRMAQEVGSNLRQIEEALDAFFRDPVQRDSLAPLPALAAQAHGALVMLELPDAAALLDAATTAVEPFRFDGEPDDSVKMRIADAFSSLGLYVEAHCSGRADALRIIQPVLAAFGLDPLLIDEHVGDESVEAGIGQRKADVAVAYLGWRQTAAASAKKQFIEVLVELGRDAELIDDAMLKRAVEALLANARAATVGDAGLDAQVEALSGRALPQTMAVELKATEVEVVAVPSIEFAVPNALDDADGSYCDVPAYCAVPAYCVVPDYCAVPDYCRCGGQAEIGALEDAPVIVEAASVPSAGCDPDMLAVFLEEAHEVLATMADALATAPTDPTALDTLRRGFHTLKGSGRMVGLDELGEAAWALEQFMSTWLADGKPASIAMTDVVNDARGLFSDWIAALEHAAPVDLPLVALLAAVADAAQAAVVTPLFVTVIEYAVALELVEPLPAPFMVGGMQISRGLYDIFMIETAQCLDVLRADQCARAASLDGVVGESARRAAHTLGGIAGTAGFVAMAELAHAMELFLNRFTARSMPAAHQALVADVNRRLHEMCDDITAGVTPQAAPDLVAAMGELGEELPASAQSYAYLDPVEPLPVAASDVLIAVAASAETFAASVEYAQPQRAEPAVPDLARLLVQTPVKTAVPVFERREVKDEIDPDLLPIFIDEADALLPDTSAQLRLWINRPEHTAARDLLRRNLHTLKGSARMVGAMRLGELTHEMESRVVAIMEGGTEASKANFDLLEAQLDRLAHAVERLKSSDAEATVEVPLPAPVEPVEWHGDEMGEGALAAQPQIRDANNLTLRVRADWIDRMVNQAGEVAIARSRIESEVFGFKRQVGELSDALLRLRGHIREVEIQAESQMQSTLMQNQEGEFDPLEFDRFTRFQEVTRFLAESVNDISTVQHILLARLGEADAALLQQARLNRELQQNLLRVRMVPLYSVAERLYRTVRQTARDVGCRAQLDIQGGDLEIDRSVLERVTAPLEHLLRNALAHGIEAAEVRRAAGKNEFGEITLNARQSGNEMMLTVKDDGAGLNFARIRDKALALGMLSPGIAPSETQLAQMIFAAGFSTAESVSEIAGRGVGMDVVKSEITALGGRIEIASTTGFGTQFTIYLPLTLAMTQAVMFSAGKQDYALPAPLVQQVIELKPEQLVAALSSGELDWRGARYALNYLPHLLGQSDAVHEMQRFNSVVLLKSGHNTTAILVDAIEGTREIVVKNIGPQLARVTGIAGATVRGDGRVILILNPLPLALRRASQPQQQTVMPTSSPVLAEARALAPLVLVVDDSLTVRKITGRLLTREGYRMDTAKDGIDALEKMQDLIPDVVLLDVEMPRMDGFELARVMKNDARLKHIPIIMITSRTADKHRLHAEDIGVDRYMGKPYQEQQLLGAIAEMVQINAETA